MNQPDATGADVRAVAQRLTGFLAAIYQPRPDQLQPDELLVWNGQAAWTRVEELFTPKLLLEVACAAVEQNMDGRVDEVAAITIVLALKRRRRHRNFFRPSLRLKNRCAVDEINRMAYVLGDQVSNVQGGPVDVFARSIKHTRG
ncbi:hypothetical protein [Dyella sp. 20L07]|uniref:hypothetical protein n=1 Tax=Dyella sp. 20L07 TaxID=3384240 RepID=UPI003D27C4C9